MAPVAGAEGSRTLKTRPFLLRRCPHRRKGRPIDSKRLTSEGYERQSKRAATGFEPVTYRLPLRLCNHVGKGFHSGDSGINIATMPGRRQFLAINTPEARKVDLPTTSLPQALARNDTFAKRVEPMDSLIDLVFAWKIRESRPAGLGTAYLPLPWSSVPATLRNRNALKGRPRTAPRSRACGIQLR